MEDTLSPQFKYHLTDILLIFSDSVKETLICFFPLKLILKKINVSENHEIEGFF